MNKCLVLILTVCYGAVLSNNALGQGKNDDSVQTRLLATNMNDAFYKAIGLQSRLYNGAGYELYNNRNNVGNAYFNDTTALVNGTVNYDGILYTQVPLIYDVYQDLLVSRITNSIFLFGLLNERVREFDLFGHHFIRIQPGDANKLVKVGFYDELYKGNLQLLAKRTKSIQKGTRGYGVAIITYFSENSYYLKKGAIYYDVNSRGKFLDVLRDKKRELKKYVKDNYISFGDNYELSMATLARYYDGLTN